MDARIACTEPLASEHWGIEDIILRVPLGLVWLGHLNFLLASHNPTIVLVLS